MKRDVTLEEISDGRLYGLNDMVKADCNDCRDCSSCCRGMGSSITLDPMDISRLTGGLGVTFEQQLAEHIELNVVDGIILPNLKMAGEGEACSFLDEHGRCQIHAIRPGICRLFPLGRFYEGGSFRYFLQIHECKKENRTKIKVKKWIDTSDISEYEPYINAWHNLLNHIQEQIAARSDETFTRQASMYLIRQFYMKPYTDGSFYQEFADRLNEAMTVIQD
ncbi:MAG: YkgJ family cysteine cluster protein [Lachnospiraceae bacterium]